MTIRTSAYHSILRISAATVAVILVFVSGLISQTTALLSQEAGSYVATAVGMSLGVTPNEINQITATLTEREQQLAQREMLINEREIELGLAAGATPATSPSTYILSAILFILLLLILLNYILDFTRNSFPNNVTFKQSRV